MNAVNNMRYLGGFATKKTSGGSKFSLKFDAQKVKFFKVGKDLLPQFYATDFIQPYVFMYQKNNAARKDRAEEETWALSRFYPMIEVHFRA